MRLPRRLPWTLLALALSLPSSVQATSLADRVQDAAHYSAAHRGQALLVLSGGREVYASGQNGFDLNSPHALASGTKSFWGLAAAAAVQDGLISSFDERLSDSLSTWRSDPRKASITVRQLLSLTSGLEPGNSRQVPSYAEAQAAPMRDAPGLRFAYGPVPFQVFGAFLQARVQPRGFSDPLAYLKARLLDPIGLRVSAWRGAGQGEPRLPSGAFLTAREWAKLGQLVLQEGAWQGQQLLRRDLLEEVFRASAANPAYGLTWWMGAPEGAGEGGPQVGPALRALPGFKMAAGAGNQRLYVIPSQQLVVVRYGDGGEYDDLAFLEALSGVRLR